MGTILSFIILLMGLSIFLYLGKKAKWHIRLLYYFLLSIIASYDIRLLSESVSLFDICFIGAFSLALSLVLFYVILFLRVQALIVLCDFIVSLTVLIPCVFKFVMDIEWFSNDVLLATFQTNLKESILFTIDNLGWAHLLCDLALLTIVSFIDRHVKSIEICNPSTIILIPILLGIAYFSATRCSGFAFANQVYQSYSRKTNYLKRNVNADYSSFSKVDKDSLTCVVVVGEALCRDYMSAYGYNVPTTPNIERLVCDSILLRHDNAYSTDIFTVVCVPRMLTSESAYCSNMDYISIDLFRKNGFECCWLSNQVGGDYENNAVSILAKNANTSLFSNDIDGYDENLLPHLTEKLQSNSARKFIVVHLAGSHAPASVYYPHIKPFLRDVAYSNETLYHYENSVIYNDSIFSEIVKLLPKRNCVMLYTSDHGEKPGIGRLYDRFDQHMVRIPLLTYFSSDLQQTKQYSNLKQNVKCYWTNDLLFNLICGISGVTQQEVLNPKYDLSSKDYNLSRKEVNLCNGRFKIEDLQ